MTDGAATGDNPAAEGGGGENQNPGQQPQSAAAQLNNEPVGGSDAGANQPTPGQDPAQAPAPAGRDPQAESWLNSQIQDPETREWLQAKGYEKAGPEAVAKSYRELEKMFGADKAGRTVVVPGAEASEQERMEVYNRLGRPETPDKYDLPFPEEGNPDFQNWAKETFHKAGLTTDQAKHVVEALSEYEQQTSESQQSQYQEQVQQQDNDLRREWGNGFDKNMAMAQRAARSLVPGNDQERVQTLDAMEQAMGYKGLMEFMSNLGQKMGEDAFVDGGKVQGTHSAKARIQELESNQEFMKRYTNGDSDAVATMRRLYQEIAG